MPTLSPAADDALSAGASADDALSAGGATCDSLSSSSMTCDTLSSTALTCDALTADEMTCGDPILYGISGGNLYTIDRFTAVRTLVGSLGLSVSHIAYDTTTSTMYGINESGGNLSLVTINLATGAATLVTTVSDGGRDFWDISFDAYGQMWGWDYANFRFVKIDKATGAFTNMGASGLSGSDINSLAVSAFDDSGTLWLVARAAEEGGTQYRFYTTNLSSGAATFVYEDASPPGDPGNVTWQGGTYLVDDLFFNASGERLLRADVQSAEDVVQVGLFTMGSIEAVP